MEIDNDNDEYYIPLEDQRVFGAGIKRKRIAFIPAATEDPTIHSTPQQNAGDKYLSIVLSKNSKPQTGNSDLTQNLNDADPPQDAVSTVCPICQQLLITERDGKSTSNTHATSIAHQVCLEHSHPPSHLDRDRVGLQYLSTYGWDPDARRGLGARQEGIRFPVKTKEKNNTAGLGLFNSLEEEPSLKKKQFVTKQEVKTENLDAKSVRKMEKDKSDRAATLRQAFYADDLSKYLGPAG